MKTFKYILILCVAGTVNMKAQNFIDAFRYSQNLYMGTGRSSAMGSAFGCMGGDFSSISINPGGLGVYRASEFSFTPGMLYNKANAGYLGSNASDFNNKVNFNNVGYVYTNMTGSSDGLVSISFATGYNRLNDFNQNVSVRGENLTSSISDMFMTYANGYTPDYLHSYYERLAFDTYVIDTVPGTVDQYTTPVELTNKQSYKSSSYGRKGEWVFALGANISNKLYLGASFGYESILYKNTYDYTETNTNPNPAWGFVDMKYHGDLTSSGSGWNCKLGAIFKPVKFLRIGLAVHTPTVYHFTDLYDARMTSNIYDVNGVLQNYEAYPTDIDGYRLQAQETSYKLKTPLKAILSAGMTIGKFASASVEAEYVDYKTMRFTSIDYDYEAENTDIADLMKPIVNLRAGGEIKLGSIYLRAGAGYYPSPFNTAVRFQDDMFSGSLGFGYRTDNFFIDLAYTSYFYQQNKFLYDVEASQAQYYGAPSPAAIHYNNNRLIATFGFRF